MRRPCLTLFFVVMTGAATAIAGPAPDRAPEQRQADARKILAEARSELTAIKSPRERDWALQTVGEVLVRAGDEAGAIEIDKKMQNAETPPPILKAVALAQLRGGHVDDAVITARKMKDPEACDLTLMALAEAADDGGDAEMAGRLCYLVSGSYRLEALLLAARIQQKAADLEGSDASLNTAKVLAHRQPDVAKVAETEALLGHIEHADRLMGRLRRETDRAHVLAAMVLFDVAAKDFESANAHLDLIGVDTIKSSAQGMIAIAHAENGQVKDAVEQIAAISDDDTRLRFARALTEAEFKQHGFAAGHEIAVGCHDASEKAVCLSILATAAAKSGHADVAQKTMQEARDLMDAEHAMPTDAALVAVSEGLSQMEMPKEAMTAAGRMTDPAQRTWAFRNIIRTTARLHDAETARALVESIREPQDRTFSLIGIAEGLLDQAGLVDGARHE